jgi:hypothetical protein
MYRYQRPGNGSWGNLSSYPQQMRHLILGVCYLGGQRSCLVFLVNGTRSWMCHQHNWNQQTGLWVILSALFQQHEQGKWFLPSTHGNLSFTLRRNERRLIMRASGGFHGEFKFLHMEYSSTSSESQTPQTQWFWAIHHCKNPLNSTFKPSSKMQVHIPPGDPYMNLSIWYPLSSLQILNAILCCTTDPLCENSVFYLWQKSKRCIQYMRCKNYGNKMMGCGTNDWGLIPARCALIFHTITVSLTALSFVLSENKGLFIRIE